MRERGSNAARPTKKGVGGLPIGARPADFGASIGRDLAYRARRFGRNRSRFGRNRSRFGRDLAYRARRCLRRQRRQPKARRKHKKSPIPRGNRARCYRKASRALRRLLVPHASTCASAQNVLRAQVHQWCIVMITSDRRHIGRCI